MSMLRYVERAIHNNSNYTSFDGLYSSQELETVMSELAKEIEKTEQFLHHDAGDLGVCEADVSYYAGLLYRMNQTQHKLEMAEPCESDYNNSKGRKVVVGFDVDFDRF